MSFWSHFVLVRDWSLITVRGRGYKTGCEVLPLQKGETEQVLAMLEGGHKRFWGSFYAKPSSFGHIEGGGGPQKVSTL